MSIENHDYAISYVLGLSHMVNIAFAKVLASSEGERESLPELSSTTFKDQLNVAKRVTDENPHLYYEIQHLPFGCKDVTLRSQPKSQPCISRQFWLCHKWFHLAKLSK